jgi:hypothetical protein
VELVDPLSTDEAYESIRADMSYHDRRPSHAHLLPHILMNTRRRAHGVRGQAKLSMMIYPKLEKTFENMVNQILNLEHIPMEPLTFYARWKARMKNSRSCMERRSGAPCFLYAVMRVPKVIEVERYINR